MSRLYLDTKTGATLVFIAAVLTLVLITALPAYAQTNTDDPVADPLDELLVEITGEVAFVADEDFPDIFRLTVGGVIIAPAGAFIPAMLNTGDIVTIVGYLLNDNTIMAISLEFVDPDELEDPEEPVEEAEEPVEEPVDETDAEPLPANCVPLTHPIAVSTAASFEITIEEVIALHCAGYGFGDIIRALVLEHESDYAYTVEELLAMSNRGEAWRTVMAEIGVHPSQLAPGQAIRPPGRPDHAGPPENAGPPSNHPGGGPPPHAGPPSDRPGGGPPPHAGPPSDRPGGGPPGNNPGRGRGG